MNQVPVEKLRKNTYYDAPVFLDSKYILLSPDTPVSEELIRRLSDWGFSHVYSEGRASNTPPRKAETQHGSDSVSLIETDVKEKEHREEAIRFYQQLLNFTESVLTRYSTKNEIPIAEITDKVKETIDAVRDKRRYLLRFSDMADAGKNYIVGHSTRTTILALAVGTFLKLPAHKLIELGTAAFLHEIGMVKLPQRLYMSPTRLTPEQMKTLTAHTILGYKSLKGTSLPLSIAIAVLEHHERVDGSGYPRGLNGPKISLYARIIGVVCSYDAITSDRPYREANDGHAALLMMLKDAGTLFDETILRALVFCLSVYPLGTYVALTSGAKGVVVDTGADTPKFPTVRIIVDESGNVPADQPVVQTGSGDGWAIARVLQKDELSELRGYV
jgi:HD-GYP domain-containing protein (c-di-GMP phosphodiesterase class II)